MEGGNQTSKNHAKLTNVEPAIKPCLDRISSLPDSILCHILSFIPSKKSVATSILARRWRFLWTQVMSAEFNVEGENVDIEAFRGNINRFLLLNTSRCIRIFKLSLDEWFTKYDLDTWISAAAVRNVQVFDLDVYTEFRLPLYLAYSKTLVEFKLSHCGDLCVGTVCLPNVKKIYFDSVCFEIETLSNLISGCLVLEDLTILNFLNSDVSHISSPTLKRLKLNSLPIEFLIGPCYRVMRLNTPSLKYLDQQDHLSNDISSQELPSLVEARIELCNEDLKRDVFYLRSIFDYVERVSMVKFLALSCPLEMKLISTTFSASTTKFDNLTELDFAADWRFLTKFLESADNLEVLIIRKVTDNLKCMIVPEKVPVCLLSCLREVTIHLCGWNDPAFELARYILGNAKFLKRMEIYYSRYGTKSDSESYIRQKISLFQRGSKACKVLFY